MRPEKTEQPRVDVRHVICPVCDGPLTAKSVKGRITCRECGSTFRIDEIEDSQAHL